MLKLRRGVVVDTEPLLVRVGSEERPAWADARLVGEVHRGDEVVVNVEARDLGLGSGGFDVVHVNLTRGLEGPGATGGEHVIKLNYTSLQHPVDSIESVGAADAGRALGEAADAAGVLGGEADAAGALEDAAEGSRALEGAVGAAGSPLGGTADPGAPAGEVRSDRDAGGADRDAARPRVKAPPVLVIPVHGHLAPAVWAAHQARPGIRVGFVQGWGGALPGSLSRDVIRLRAEGLVCGHVTAGPAHGGEREAISLAGALDAAARALAWDAAVVGPGPGILGSASQFGHGGMAALDGAHASLAVGLPTLLSPRLSSSDPRPRHRGLSHHTAVVLRHLLAPVRVPVPETEVEGWPLLDTGAPEGGTPQAALDSLIELCAGRHDIAVERIDLDGYAASGLPQTTMGRTIAEDPLFFAAPLAAGVALVGAASGGA